ncbi:MAG: hypothetical protein C0404_07055 [Verrucomicrobia bacterium]|nr:hypothetical protein [Verrucomicrobiota bacterium]
MKTVLINTLVNFMSSPQGPARLYGYARQQGMDIGFLNLNHDIYSYLLSKQTLSVLLGEARTKLFMPVSRDQFFRRNFGSVLIKSSAGELPRLVAGILAGQQLNGLGRLAESAVSVFIRSRLNADNIAFALWSCMDEVAERIGAAQESMERNFWRQGSDEFITHFRTLLAGKAIIDALHYPAQLDFGLGFQGGEWGPTAEDVLRATTDRRHNYLIRYYESEVMDGLCAEAPGLVGLSATHLSELIPVFTLARLIRERLPETHIVLGGAGISDIRDRLAANQALWHLIDSVVYGPGEVAFMELTEAVEDRRPLAHVPNLLYRDGNRIRLNERTAELEPDEYATPEYVNLRPGSGVALETSTSCYWGKCAFCYYPSRGQAKGRPASRGCNERSLERVFEDIETLRRRHNPSYIGFTDASFSPARLEAVAEYNLNAEHPVPFSAFVRLEKEFASGAFCRKLAAGGFLGGQSGLETGTERVNAMINKGIDLSLVPTILGNFRKNGILLHLYTIVGFPGESEKEAWETYRFIRRHHRKIPLDWQIYALGVLENGPLVARARELGLTLKPLPPNILVPLCTHEVRDGLSQAESIRLSIVMERKLARYRNRLSSWMDVELYKVFLLKRRSDSLSGGSTLLKKVREFCGFESVLENGVGGNVPAVVACEAGSPRDIGAIGEKMGGAL